ncbi:UDP-3-O-acyl-N-acetylglucosamine deacetylase [Candidatus Kinetoplastidibacterium galati]|uniref:UDP-3-O-acyl-N-acetylglucosamine deacetylase n=1 Tax=Candidatus Kinetoplastidibacterium galati TCC219 TaxID=1208921 RepID=M1M228_9PROT|nr:UDP-3-O-acyl-N-acetylglucosamine deacetylase [Candidatus Kinetoplastibacterium galatii]AGF49269.1 UDP-3-O-[3-hydroxymyristoyl] N-acetylglucosamine deacetylase [Candidatus Kinetoplastibacterium galatii TCC219]
MFKQCTISVPVSVTGICLHSGKMARIVLRPAEVNTGVIFHRVDLHDIVDIPAKAEYISDMRLATVLQKGSVRISTIEHLMSALHGLGIDNIHIDVNSEEIPILDGSSDCFVDLLERAHIKEQEFFKDFIRITDVVEISEGGGDNKKWARLEPYNGFVIAFSIDFKHPVISSTANYIEIDISKDSYIKDIAKARTFGFINELKSLNSIGLACGGSFDNAIVMDDFRILNQNGLRYKDEFVKHKVLDAIGDLYLLGKPLLGRFVAHRSGHSLNAKLVNLLLSKSDSWEVVRNNYETPLY